MTETKLYYWRSESYGEEACVAAASLEEAQGALRNSMADYFPAPGASLFGCSAYESNHPMVVEKMLAGDGYELVVLEPGRVVWTEVS